MFCYKCGTQIDDNFEFCYKCGAKLNRGSTPAAAGTQQQIAPDAGINNVRQLDPSDTAANNTQQWNTQNTAANNTQQWNTQNSAANNTQQWNAQNTAANNTQQWNPQNTSANNAQQWNGQNGNNYQQWNNPNVNNGAQWNGQYGAGAAKPGMPGWVVPVLVIIAVCVIAGIAAGIKNASDNASPRGYTGSYEREEKEEREEKGEKEKKDTVKNDKKDEYSVYKNSRYGFSFEYPSSWTADESDEDTAVSIEYETADDYVSFAVGIDYPDPALESYNKEELRELFNEIYNSEDSLSGSDVNSITVGEVRDTTVDGISAIEVTVTMTYSNGRTVEMTQVFFNTEDNLFCLTWGSTVSEYNKELSRILRTFKVK